MKWILWIGVLGCTLSVVKCFTQNNTSETSDPLPPPHVTPFSDFTDYSQEEEKRNVNSSSSSNELLVDSQELAFNYLDPSYSASSDGARAKQQQSSTTSQISSKHKKYKLPPGLKKKKIIKTEVKVTDDYGASAEGTFSPTSFENKLPFDGKETEESASEDDDEEYDDDGDFFYDGLEELAPPLINAFTRRPPPPYKLQSDEYDDDDDYYDEDPEYPSHKDDIDDQDMSFTSFFMDLFYELFARFTGNAGGSGEDDEEYYDENNYAARRTTPRAYRKPKRPSYNQFLGFYEEDEGNKLQSKTQEDVAESKWLSWFDSGSDAETLPPVESTTLPMTTESASDWGLFNLFSINRENRRKSRTTSPASNTPPTTTSANIPALLSALTEHLITTTSPPPRDLPVAKPGTQKSYKNYQLWRLKPLHEEHLNVLNGVRLYQDEYQWWQGPTVEGKTDVLVPPNKVDEFRELLSEEEIKYTTTIRDLDMAIRFSNPQVSRAESFQLEAIQGHPMTWHNYHRYSDLMKYYEYLHRKYPKNVDLIHIGRTFEGRPIVVCHIFERPPKLPHKKLKRKKQSIFIESGMRGHEWIGPAVATWILQDLARNNFHLTNRTLDGILISREWYILPVANPDGYEYSHTTDRLWTKNRSRRKKTSASFFSNFFSMTWFSKGNADQEDLKQDETCLGVDLARNFDFRWNRDKNINSRALCSNDYAGIRPFSESETKALAKFLIKIAPTLKLYVSLQSYGQFISIPAPKQLPLERYEMIQSAESAVNSLRKFGLPMVKYFVDEDASLRDSVAGSSDGFVTRELEIKRAFTIKLRDTGENGFLLPPSYIETTARETFEMIKIMVDDLRRKNK